jgi:hypothetical protein
MPRWRRVRDAPSKGIPRPRLRGRGGSYTRWPTAKARLGHRVNANTHKLIRFTSGTNARIVHHRLRPAIHQGSALALPSG